MNIMDVYFKDIKGDRYAPLTASEEKELLKSWPHCKQQLIEHNLRFAVDMAKRLKNSHIALPDLIEYANTGLCLAADRFDPGKGCRFISYAVWWVNQQLLFALCYDRAVRVPVNVQDDIKEIDRFVDAFVMQHERMPTANEVIDNTSLTDKRYGVVQQSQVTVMSLDWESENDDYSSVGHKTIAADDPSILEGAIDTDTRGHLDALLCDKLEDREVDVLKSYYGFYGGTRTLEDIAVQYGLTRERIRQIKEKALRKLNHPSNKSLLAELA